MIIDKVKLNEIDIVKKLLSKVWIDTYEKMFSREAIDKITSSWHSRSLLLSQASDEDFYFAVAKIDNKIVGLITVKQFPDRSLFLYRLYIDPQYQRQRIGIKLLDSAIGYFPGAKKIKLECEKQNGKACAFYLHKGFKKTGEKEELVEGVKMQAVEFKKSIN